MTKEEILNREYTTQCAGNTSLLMRLFPEKDKQVVLAAMDEYAKQQSVDFFKWYGTRMASLTKYICEIRPIAEDKKMEEIILKHEGATLDQLYSQFIEQQNKP